MTQEKREIKTSTQTTSGPQIKYFQKRSFYKSNYYIKLLLNHCHLDWSRLTVILTFSFGHPLCSVTDNPVVVPPTFPVRLTVTVKGVSSSLLSEGLSKGSTPSSSQICGLYFGRQQTIVLGTRRRPTHETSGSRVHYLSSVPPSESTRREGTILNVRR